MNLTKCITGKNGSRDGWFIKFLYDAEFLEEFKDAIDRPYRDWNLATKTWWVDEECGGMLAGIFENWDMPINQPKNTMYVKPRCPICNDKGLVPSKVLGKFSGKTIPNCYSRCKCNPEIERYHRVRLSDFDFPMSDAFRGFSYEYCGMPDPAEVPETIKSEEQPEPVSIQEPWDKRQQYQVDQLRSQVLHLEHKIQEITKRKAKPQTQKSNYKGLVVNNEQNTD